MFKRQEAAVSEPKKSPALKAFADRWIVELNNRDLKYSTKISYASNLKHHIIPALGEYPISEIDYALLKEFIVKKAEGTYSTARFRKPREKETIPDSEEAEVPPGRTKTYSRDTIRVIVMTLRVLMGEAAREKLISANPVANLSPFYRRQKRERSIRRSDVYRPEELYLVEDVLRTKRTLFEPDAYELSLCMSRTGMRVGEARGIMPADLDFRARTIELQRNIPSGHSHLEESTKGKLGHRTVDMGRDLHLALKAMLARRHQEDLKAGGAAEASAWLFYAPQGGPVSYERIYTDWCRAQKIAGVRIRSPHCLRHTYASISLQRGEDLAYVSKQLGHANPEITLAIYTHFMPRKRRRSTNALDRSVDAAKRINLDSEVEPKRWG